MSAQRQQIPPQMMQQQFNQPQFMQQSQNALQEQLQNLNIGGGGKGPSKEEKNKFPSLYVSNLPKESFFDLDFYKFFTSKGYKLKSAKVVLHKKSSKPLGYGYLQFHTQEQADRCLEEMNNTVLNGLPLRIVHSVSKIEYNEKANLLVKNIDKDVTQQELFETFKQFGDIQSCKLETYHDGQSKGYAYIQFSSEEEADKALEGMNEKEINGKKIEVHKHEKKDKRDTQVTAKFNNLFVKNLPKGTDDAKLQELFAKFGDIESVHVQRDESQGLKDYGYVCFKDPDHAEQAIQEMNKKQIAEDHFLIVNKHVSKKDNEPVHGSRALNPITQNLTKTFNSNIYVKFIPNDVTEDELKKTFSIKDSNIVSVKLSKCIKKYDNEEVQPYQFAFILYDTVTAAQKAIQTFDQSTIFGSKPLLVELWVSKEEKEQERKKKESQTINQFLSNMLLPQGGVQYQQQQQQPGNMMGGAPQGGMYQQNQFQQRGGAGGYRGRGGRGGQNRGGHRGGHMQQQPGMGGQQQYQRPPMQGGFNQQFPGAYPQQMQQPFGMGPQGFPMMGGMPPQQQIQQVQLLPLPQVDASQLQSINDLGDQKQFVGNAIYPQIEGAFGEKFAGKITGMLLDENVVDFSQLLSNQSYFTQKAREAFNLLLQSNQQQQPMQQQ